MEHVRKLIEDLLSRFETMGNTKTVVGDPMEVKGTILVPLIELSIGVGAGGGEGTGEGGGTDDKGREGKGKGEGKGAGAGGGLKVTPISVICVDASGVSAFSVAEKKGFLNKLADLMPQIMEKAAEMKKPCPGEEPEGRRCQEKH